MIKSVGECELEGHDDANIPVNIFITEIVDDDERYVPDPEEEDEALRSFNPKWALSADLFMPGKNRSFEGGVKYLADTKEELHELVKEKILPTYKIAMEAITAIGEGARTSFYYWMETDD